MSRETNDAWVGCRGKGGGGERINKQDSGEERERIKRKRQLTDIGHQKRNIGEKRRNRQGKKGSHLIIRSAQGRETNREGA